MTIKNLKLRKKVDDTQKIMAATVIAGSVGGLSGHTIGTGTEVNSQTIEGCHAFIEHAKNHMRHTCDLKLLNMKLGCNDVTDK